MSVNTAENSNRNLKRLVFALFGVVVVLAALLIVQLTRQSPATLENQPSAGTTADAAKGDSASGGNAGQVSTHPAAMTIGDPDAPVVLREWVDMGCPYCALFTTDTLPTLISEYVDTKQVRIEVNVVSFFGEGSDRGAVAAHEAANQGRFKEFLDVVYAAAPEGKHPDLTQAELVEFAKQAGIKDITAFEAALADPANLARVQKETAAAQAVGVTSVPFFAIGNQGIAGAQPVSVFRDFISSQGGS